ncbi:hypothetical protein [Paenisporosarcina sp. TG-14]|uniref:hypothetical protein n=1 Tax=Paenisporosarcina sp. TG-14 TaxID=1231057 RepID=UPI0002EC17E6|nr:hypothetical protein [Paenisporosarcina sp. TG-14]
MKKILIVTHWFFPRNVPRAFRTKELVTELVKKGYLVDVLIGDYKQLVTAEEYHDKLFENKDVSNKHVAKISNNRLLSKIKDAVNYFVGDRFLLTTGFYLYKNINMEKYDTIIAIGLPFYVNFVTALKIRRHKKEGSVYIADWSDPFYKTGDKMLAPYFNKLQIFACSQFNYITIPTKAAVSYFTKFTSESKIKIIPQGFDFSAIKVVPYKKNKRVTFGYAGIFYKDIRNPEKFLSFLTEINSDFVFVLYTITHGPIYTDILLKYKEILGDRLQIHNLIPRNQCITMLSEMDFLINIENSTSNQIPSKLIDYSLSGRPILSFKQNEIPKDKIISFMNEDYKEATKIEIDQFDIINVCKQYLDLLEDVESNLC